MGYYLRTDTPHAPPPTQALILRIAKAAVDTFSREFGRSDDEAVECHIDFDAHTAHVYDESREAVYTFAELGVVF